MDRDDAAYEGQREYTPLFLRIYDPLILGLFAPVVWRCQTTRLLEGYRRHLGHRHLDVGPGTGYFLERAGLPDDSSVTLLDPNAHVLDHASRRLQRLDITAVEAEGATPGCRGTCSGPTTGEAPSTTSATPTRASARSLMASFEHVELETVGTMAVFAARTPRAKPSTGMTP